MPVVQKLRSLFLRRAFTCNCIVSSTLLAVGDIIQQRYEIYRGTQSAFDMKRICKMTCAGFVVGAYCHHFYLFLDRALPGKDINTLVKKVIWDNLQAAIQFAILFAVLAVFEKQSILQYLDELWTKGRHLYLTSSCIYVPAQFFNFYVLPPHYRVLYVSVLNLCFDTYSSYIAHNQAW